MKSKTSLINGKLYGDALKRNWWFGFIVFMTFLFMVTVNVTFQARNFTESEDILSFQRLLTGFFYGEGSGLVADMVVAMIFGACAGLVFYSYMHHKREVDFFHGQPVRRETLLFTRYLAGATLFAVPYLVNLLFAFFILLGYGASPMIFGQLLMRFAAVLIAYSMLFAFSALSAVLTGNAFAHLQTGFMLCFGVFFILESLLWFANTYLKSFSLIDETGIYYGSALVRMIKTAAEMEFGLGAALCYILIAAAALAFALWLYQRRPSEAAGAMFAFPAAEPVYRALLSIVSASLMGSIFYDSSSQSMAFTILGVLLGMFLAHIFCQGQFKRSFNGMFSAWKPYAITVAAYLLVMMAFVFDITGYDKYQPAPTEIASIAISTDGDENRILVKNERNELESVDALEYCVFDDENLQSTFLNMAQAGIENNARRKADKNWERSNNGYTLGYTLRYTLANGRQVQRRYDNVPMEGIAEEIKKISTDPVYLSKNQLFLLSPEDYTYISVYSQGDGNYHNAANKEEKRALVLALMEDVSENGMPADEAPIAWVDAQCLGKRNSISQSLYIYKSYSRCLPLLEKWGIDTQLLPQEDADKIVYAEVAQYDGKEDVIVYSTDDAANIRKMLNSGALVNNCPTMTLRVPYSVRFYKEEDLARKKEYDAQAATAEEKDYYYYDYVSWNFGVIMGGLSEFGVMN